MNWSKKKRFVRDVARGAVGTKAVTAAATMSSFAVIFALCMMPWSWLEWARIDFYRQQRIYPKPQIDPQLVELARRSFVHAVRVS